MGFTGGPIATGSLLGEENFVELDVVPALPAGVGEDSRAGLADVAQAEPKEEADEV